MTPAERYRLHLDIDIKLSQMTIEQTSKNLRLFSSIRRDLATLKDAAEKEAKEREILERRRPTVERTYEAGVVYDDGPHLTEESQLPEPPL